MRRPVCCAATLAAVAAVGLLVGPAAGAQNGDPFGDTSANLARESSIAYYTRPANDPVAQLEQRIRSGRVHLRFDPGSGYLQSVLTALKLSADSQLLVFSKTSVQSVHINPHNPRAIYFNDFVEN